MCQQIEWNNTIYSLKQRKPQLPVERRGKVFLADWRGYLTAESLKAGQLNGRRAELVEIPATRGTSNGITFQVRQGIRGVLLRGPKNEKLIYMLTAPSTHYFRTMTGSARMPVLIKQVI